MKHTEKELHVTMKGNLIEYERLKDHLKGTKWHTSRIAGDPKLGPGIKMYATANIISIPSNAKRVVLAMAGELKQAGFVVVRAKVEEIIYDVIFGVKDVQGS